MLPKLSKKRLAQLDGKKIYSTIKPSGKAPRKRKRKPSETLRIYGTPERRAWLKTQPCSACGIVGYSEGAHVLGNGGMGRKADADTQAPLCGIRPMFSEFDETLYCGCHFLYDNHRNVFNTRFPDFNSEQAARQTERAWQDHLTGESAT